MKGYRFYAEYEDKKAKRKDNPPPKNVVALLLDKGRPIGHWRRDTYFCECVSAVFYHANSGVCHGSVHDEYLRDNCKRISEAKAREIHPQMFVVLDHYTSHGS